MGVLEKKCFEIISNVGLAKSNYIEAMSSARNYNFEEAKKLIGEAEKLYNNAHIIHSQFLQQEANGVSVDISLLLIHTEDQLITTESIKVSALEVLEVYKKISEIEKYLKGEEQC